MITNGWLIGGPTGSKHRMSSGGWRGGKGHTLIDAHFCFTLQISSVTAAAPISQQAPISQPSTFPPSHSTLVDNLALNSADESLADLQPEDSEGEEEEEERAPLTPEQKVSHTIPPV